jgi:hypothetical protein
MQTLTVPLEDHAPNPYGDDALPLECDCCPNTEDDCTITGIGAKDADGVYDLYLCAECMAQTY